MKLPSWLSKMVFEVEEVIHPEPKEEVMSGEETAVPVVAPVAVEPVPAPLVVDVDVLIATLKAGLITFGYNIPEFDTLAAASKIKATQ